MGWPLRLLPRPPTADSGLGLSGARLRLLLHTISLADQSTYGIQRRLWMLVLAGGRQADDDPGAVPALLGLHAALQPSFRRQHAKELQPVLTGVPGKRNL